MGMTKEAARQTMVTIEQAMESGLTMVRNGVDVPISSQSQYTIPKGEKSFTDFFFTSVMTYRDLSPPPYQVDSRTRDRWLLEFVAQEPHLHGVQKTACSLVANRGWKLTGDEELVLGVRDFIHNADMAEGYRFGQGWRHFIGNGAKAYYNTDINFIAELGREDVGEGLLGPIRAMWSTDPARFKLTGDPRGPLKYKPYRNTGNNGAEQIWKNTDFLRIVNNPNLDEEFLGLGYCTISVVIELAKIMIAVYEYDKEKLGAQAPKGLLLLRNISENQWRKAMEARETKLEGKNQQYYGGLAVLASLGSADIDAKLLPLSELPENFDRQQFITLLMYLYSLSFGFSPDEFWPVQIGWLLGRNTEAELGLERATQKGDADFFLAFQDRFQQELPSFGDNEPSVLFTFDERNDRGRQVAADVAHTWSRVAERLYGTTVPDENGLMIPILDRDQTLELLVRQGVLPPEITDIDEDTQASDTHAVREMNRARRSPGILRMAKYFPSRPIVMYRYPENDMTVLFDRADEILRPTVWSVDKDTSEYTGEVRILNE